MTARRISILSLFMFTSLATAQDRKPDKNEIDQQRAVLLTNMKRADLPRISIVETENFFVATTTSEEKAKALGAVLDKVAPLAMRAAQFEEKEVPWKGKLAVIHLPDSRDFKGFMRNVVGTTEVTGPHYALREDAPYLVDPVMVPASSTESDRFAAAAASVATAYLKAKYGAANLPEWLSDAFGRVIAMRAEGTNSKRYTAYRTVARNAVGPKAVKPVALNDLWAENRTPQTESLTASFVEYLAFGPEKDKFSRFVFALRPDENGIRPSVQKALEEAGWKDSAALDKAWRKWVLAGK